MTQEPTFPANSVPGRVFRPESAPAPVAEAGRADAPAPPAPPAPDGPQEQGFGRWQTAGVALGIGSAAIAAALLYANRSRIVPARAAANPARESD